MSELSGRTALVTGASRGIGLAIANTLAGAGARVVICGRKQETLDRIAEANPSLLPAACHVGRESELRQLVDRAEREAGPIDILVNNAGTNIAQGPCLEMDDAQFDKMVEINLKSTFRLMRMIAPGMCRRGRGSVINIASVAGRRPQYHSLLYSMTKAALIMLTHSYAQELGVHGVRVNAIAPGLVETALSEYFWKDPARREEFLKQQSMPRIGTPREIAEIALLLASDRSSYLTGQVVTVDGGLLLS